MRSGVVGEEKKKGDRHDHLHVCSLDGLGFRVRDLGVVGDEKKKGDRHDHLHVCGVRLLGFSRFPFYPKHRNRNVFS